MELGFSFSYITTENYNLLIRAARFSKGLNIAIRYANTP
jgi:hypothetical protein